MASKQTGKKEPLISNYLISKQTLFLNFNESHISYNWKRKKLICVFSRFYFEKHMQKKLTVMTKINFYERLYFMPDSYRVVNV